MRDAKHSLRFLIEPPLPKLNARSSPHPSLRIPFVACRRAARFGAIGVLRFRENIPRPKGVAKGDALAGVLATMFSPVPLT